MYAIFPQFEKLNVAYGMILIGFAVLKIISAFCIIRCKKAAVRLIPMSYFLAAGLSTVYLIASYLIIKSTAIFTVDIIASIVFAVVMGFVNITYFNNRKDIFIR